MDFQFNKNLLQARREVKAMMSLWLVVKLTLVVSSGVAEIAPEGLGLKLNPQGNTEGPKNQSPVLS